MHPIEIRSRENKLRIKGAVNHGNQDCRGLPCRARRRARHQRRALRTGRPELRLAGPLASSAGVEGVALRSRDLRPRFIPARDGDPSAQRGRGVRRRLGLRPASPLHERHQPGGSQGSRRRRDQGLRPRARNDQAGARGEALLGARLRRWRAVPHGHRAGRTQCQASPPAGGLSFSVARSRCALSIIIAPVTSGVQLSGRCSRHSSPSWPYWWRDSSWRSRASMEGATSGKKSG